MLLGADGIATGHYARIQQGKGGSMSLLSAVDKNKDQSYFLAFVKQNALRRAIFPLGDLLKPYVRDIAASANLHVASKRDSTGICFVGKRKFGEFISTYMPPQDLEAGPFICIDSGRSVGQHDGFPLYTPGQRARLKSIAGPEDSGRWYVVAKDPTRNTILVCLGAEHEALRCTEVLASPNHWILGDPPAHLMEGGELRCKARVRYRQQLVECTASLVEEDPSLSHQRCLPRPSAELELRVRFDAAIAGAAEGQAVVLYDGDRCLGGGIIRRRGWDVGKGVAPIPAFEG